jgi:hypothetical protein
MIRDPMATAEFTIRNLAPLNAEQSLVKSTRLVRGGSFSRSCGGVVNNVHGCRDTSTARSSEEHKSGAPVIPMSKKIPSRAKKAPKPKASKEEGSVSYPGKERWVAVGRKEEEKVDSTYASIKKAAQPPCKLPSGLSMSKNGVGLADRTLRPFFLLWTDLLLP